MDAFNDGVGLWVLYCSRARLNVVAGQHFLEMGSNEFNLVPLLKTAMWGCG